MNKRIDLFDRIDSRSPCPTPVIEVRDPVARTSRLLTGFKIGVAASAVMLTGVIIGSNLILAGTPTLPPVDELWTLNRAPAIQFLDARGETLAVRGHLYGPILRSADVPAYVSQAFIAAEDQRFMEHSGIDLRSILRAVGANLAAGTTVQGASTLTQQLVKNLLVGNDRTFVRKVQEARLAIEMDATLSKQQILDLYINRVYLGSNAYGVEAAAQTYFDKPASKLTLAEAAFLGALPKAPTRYAANKAGSETIARMHYVLNRMVANRFATPAEAADAKIQPMTFVDNDSRQPVSGHVLDEAMKAARIIMPNLPPDAVITLTLNGDLQRRAERALELALVEGKYGASEGAIVVLDRAGGIRALVGGRNYGKSQFNRATQAQRQPGSAFKTLVYAAALEQGLEPTTVRNDSPVTIGTWQPQNYRNEYSGPMTLAKAMAVSSNSVAAQVGTEVGPQKIAELAARFGIKSPLLAYPSIALGAGEVTLLEMTSAYSVLANEGRRVEARLVSQIRDQRGKVLYVAPKAQLTQVYSSKAAAVMTGMLSNVVQSGTGTQAKVPGWPIAGKTGTSQSWRDAWFVGYSAHLVGGVWIGNDDDRGTQQATGGNSAAVLFARVMTSAHRGIAPEPLQGAEAAATWLDVPLDHNAEDETVQDLQPDLALRVLQENAIALAE